MTACLLPLLGALALALGAEDSTTAKARAEVERELQQVLPRVPAPQLTLSLQPSAGRGYALEQVAISLDGAALPLPDVATLKAAAGAQRLFQGEIAPGPHVLAVRMQYAGDFGLLSYMTGYKFKLHQRVEFDAARGLALSLAISPTLDDEKEWQQRLALKIDRSEEMLAVVDATEPAPLPRPQLAAAPPPPPPPPPVEPTPTKEPAVPAAKVAEAPARPKARIRTAVPAPATEPEPVVEISPALTAVPAPAEPPPVVAAPTEPPAPAPTPPPALPAAAAAPPKDPRYLIGALGLLALAAIAFVMSRRKPAR